MRVELGRDVVAQPLGVQAQVEVLQRRDAGAAALAHLVAAQRDEAVHEHVVGRLAAREVQHRGPEQRVEVRDVLADEMHLLHVGVGEKLVVVDAGLGEIVLQGGEVADRGVQPDVEVLARRVGDLDAEVGRVAADVPVAQATGTGLLVLVEPFLDLVEHLGLQAPDVGRPFLQEVEAARVGQAEEVVLAAAQHRHGAAQRRVRVLQLGGVVDGAAVLARVAVLVLGAAARALALDEAVGQEHRLHRVEELLDRLHVDQLVLAQRQVDLLGQRVVLRRIGGAPVVERDVEAVEVLRAAGGHLGHEGLRRLALLLGRDHDGRAVRVVGAHEMHLGAVHALEPHPDVGLDVLHHVPDVEGRIGVGQGGGDEEFAGHGGQWSPWWRLGPGRPAGQRWGTFHSKGARPDRQATRFNCHEPELAGAITQSRKGPPRRSGIHAVVKCEDILIFEAENRRCPPFPPPLAPLWPTA